MLRSKALWTLVVIVFMSGLAINKPLFANDGISLGDVEVLSPTWVRRTAREVHRRCNDMYNTAAQYSRREREDERLLADLLELARSAGRFRNKVDSWYDDPAYAQREFRNLVEQFRVANRSLTYSRLERHLRGSMDYVGSLLRELRRYFRDSDDYPY
ncbi:MAG TPA: hypothetical protein VJB34_10380 [Bdellovibrionota bacterium]|nr:hypothetical protein [Bdellovibrionota bacterium]